MYTYYDLIKFSGINQETYLDLESSYKFRITKSINLEKNPILNSQESKKEMLMDMLINIEYDRDVDFILYRQAEYDEYKKNTTTFASLIDRKGVCIYG